MVIKLKLTLRAISKKRFCKKSCASSSRKHTEKSKEKTSQAIKKYRSSLTPEQLKNNTFGGKTHDELKQLKIIKWADNFRKKVENILNSEFNNLTINEKRIFLITSQQYKCSVCNCSSWNNKPLTLELDHITGNRQDESRENLRLICTNCHSQTDTYKGKNVKKRVTDEHLIQILRESKSIHEVLRKCNMNFHGNNYKRVNDLLKIHNINFGV